VGLLIFLGVLVIILAAVHLILFRPTMRRLRQVKQEGREFRRRWRELDRARRREVIRALRHGQAVTEPREAELALEAVRNDARVAAAMRPLQLIYVPAIAGMLVFGIVEHSRFLIFFTAAIVGSVVLARLFVWQRTRKLCAAAAATRARDASR
jgi:Flp pilus assembly protein TadB